MHKLLDPTLDVVFKLLFTSGPDSEVALRGLLTAVLAPPRPIVAVTVTNPQLAGVELTDKGIVLDLLLELDDGTQIDLEMQADKRPAFRNRALFYWARLFGGLLERGDDYGKLKPAISILFLDYRELPGDRLHSIFHILEAHDHSRFSDAFEMHVIELPKLDHALLAADRRADDALLRWSKFFNAKTTEEANDPAMSDPAIQKAQSILERLSADPATQEIARQRQKALQTYRIEISAARDEGRSEERIEGRRMAILDACALLGIVPTPEQYAELQHLDVDGLDALRARLREERRWA